MHEKYGIERFNEPVTTGIPLRKALVDDVRLICLTDSDSNNIPFQFKAIAYWADGSVKWLLIDFLATVAGHGKKEFFVNAVKRGQPVFSPLYISQVDKTCTVSTGKALFTLSKKEFNPFLSVIIDNIETADNFSCLLTDKNGNDYYPVIDTTEIECEGAVRCTILQKGRFYSENNSFERINFSARLSFFSQSKLVKIQFSLRNENAAGHEGNLWDLGDPASFLFKKLFINLKLKKSGRFKSKLYLREGTLPFVSKDKPLKIYQDSSGGKNWKSSNHINREGKSPVSFQGYRVFAGDAITSAGHRTQPLMSVSTNRITLSCAIDKFWQNFPKSISVSNGILQTGLFPDDFNDLFELQGGEQKTHTVSYLFSLPDESVSDSRWLNYPLYAYALPERYCDSGVFESLSISKMDETGRCDELVDSAVKGDNTFFSRREIIDEYGWRNFGDIYADHEAVSAKESSSSSSPLVSHYNNQYDVIYSSLKQFARTGSLKWFKLMDELARHVIDIDIYHTGEDKPEYNNGLFWHTDHYTDAALCTHRTYSLKNKMEKKLSVYGGGPSASHNYTSGLLAYYYLTGDLMVKEVLLGMVDWTLNWVRGPRDLKGRIKNFIKKIIRNLKKLKNKGKAVEPYLFDGPGRSSGNALNALVDGFSLMNKRYILDEAETLIKKCVSPDDKIEKRDIFNSEMRWHYLIFMQSMIKYMRLKEERAELDDMYAYARRTLLHYADFMAEKEYPFLRKPQILEYPNETWGAQDMRKSNIFDYASLYTDDEEQKKKFRERADFFFKSSIEDICSFDTKTLTRPVVLLMMYGHIHSYFKENYYGHEKK